MRPHAEERRVSDASRSMGPPHPSRRALRALLRMRRIAAGPRGNFSQVVDIAVSGFTSGGIIVGRAWRSGAASCWEHPMRDRLRRVGRADGAGLRAASLVAHGAAASLPHDDGGARQGAPARGNFQAERCHGGRRQPPLMHQIRRPAEQRVELVGKEDEIDHDGDRRHGQKPRGEHHGLRAIHPARRLARCRQFRRGRVLYPGARRRPAAGGARARASTSGITPIRM